jgi:hypothetical protein
VPRVLSRKRKKGENEEKPLKKIDKQANKIQVCELKRM